MLDDAATQEYETWGPEAVDNAEARALSLRAAQESLVLLKNEAKVLPLRKGAKLAFIGPHANSTQALLSNYHGTNTLVDKNSPLAAARAADGRLGLLASRLGLGSLFFSRLFRSRSRPTPHGSRDLSCVLPAPRTHTFPSAPRRA